MLYECDTTSDGSDDTSSTMSESTAEDAITPEDKGFMKLAQDAAKNSSDNETKVLHSE